MDEKMVEMHRLVKDSEKLICAVTSCYPAINNERAQCGKHVRAAQRKAKSFMLRSDNTSSLLH
jgi:hypothetical protein